MMAGVKISHRKLWVIRVVLMCSTGLVVLLIVFSFFHTSRTLEQQRLQTVAEASRAVVEQRLKHRQFNELGEELVSFSKRYSLDAVELYRSDGSILTAYGSEGVTLPESFVQGEAFSYLYPLTFKFQHTKIFLHNGKPLGFLILYSSLREYVVFWMSLGSLGVSLLFALLVYMLFSRRSLVFQGGRGLQHEQDDEMLGRAQTSAADMNACNLAAELKALRRERDLAADSARSKGDFLANISHEIRTSLNGVVGILSLLQKSDLQQEHQSLLGAASRSADSLLLIINDILDFSKIEAGRIDFEIISFDLRQVVEESIALYIDTARVKDIDLHCYIPLDIPQQVVGDPTRLRQVLTNLLSNAVKFTEAGDVSLGVTLVRQGDESLELLFSIEDTGIGIAEDKLENIFDMFIQADSSTTRKYGGTGLGLSVCRQLVELQNGEVGVKSRPGQGASFWFTLEFGIDEAVADMFLYRNQLEEQSIALFESCETCSAIISQYLKGCVIKSRDAGSEENVLAQLRDMAQKGFLADTLLIDAEAIDTGFKQIEEGITSVYGKRQPPRVVLLSKSNGVEAGDRASVVSGVIYKPIRFKQLRDEIAGKKQSSGVDDRQAVLQPETLQGSVLLVDDEHINQHVGQMILEKLGLTVDVASSGREALEKTDKEQYDLVLMDIQMPGISGIETTEQIREREVESNSKRQTIIAVTANALASIREECLSAGMDDFIAKPIKPEQLLQILRPWLTGESGNLSSTGAASSLDVSCRTAADGGRKPKVWNRKLALEYVGGDESLLLDLMKLFIDRKYILLQAIDEAMATADGEVVSCAVHAFKGAVNHFAAQNCQQIAQNLEMVAARGWFDGIESEVQELKLAADTLEKELRRQVEPGQL